MDISYNIIDKQATIDITTDDRYRIKNKSGGMSLYWKGNRTDVSG